MRHILKCENCKKFTMKSACRCGGQAAEIKPPKFNINDPYGSYRRKAKFEKLREERLI